MTDFFNEHFGLRGKKKITLGQMKGMLSRYKLRNGKDTRFRSGMSPHNKGKKGCAAGSEKGWFRTGHRPRNYRPVGSERLNQNGYMEVKISDPKTWKAKHLIIWEKVRGPIPKGCAIIFADGNRLNVRLSNLLMVSRRELAVMNRFGFISENKDLTKVGKSIADIKLLIGVRERTLKRGR